jgi:phospho-N-acetylmuramoyl-pentapeptide-transferase
MFYLISEWLRTFWGPFRLLQSHVVMMGGGALAAAILVWMFLPKLAKKCPMDRGKVVKTVDGKSVAIAGGADAKAKPTGTGAAMALLLAPVLLCFFPIYAWESLWDIGVILCIYACMISGYLDDRADIPWSGLKKGLFDVAVSCLTAICLCHGQDMAVWWPFTRVETLMPVWLYVPIAGALLFGAINTTNCSDGIDGLAGLLTLLSLTAMAILLYVVIGHSVVADYLLIPHSNSAAKWAVLVSIFAGSMGAYLWYNCNPSSLLMGDAGSRMFGMVIGIAALMSGNFCVLLAVAPMILINGGLGLVKLACLRVLRLAGHPVNRPEPGQKPTLLQRIFFTFTFPLHDHFRKQKGWSGQQVVIRFLLLQALLLPVLFMILIKVR